MKYGSNVLISGGSGFVGTALLRHPAFAQAHVIGRNQPNGWVNFTRVFLEDEEDLSDCLKEIEIIIHCAGRAHIMNEIADNPLEEFRRANVNATMSLARQASQYGVKRFIFLSSAKVLGEFTPSGEPFKASDPRSPQDAYSVSKAEAEAELLQLLMETNMEIVIIRPPLIYGPGVKGNFARLVKLVLAQIPLPFRSIKNRRSLIYVGNLVDFIITCLEHPNAKNRAFLVSDGVDLSTADLLKEIAEATHTKSLIFPFPISVASTLLKLSGKSNVADRLFNSMQLDISDTERVLGWVPPYDIKTGLLNSALSKDTVENT